MSENINITCTERKLMVQVQALQSQHDELLHENNLIRARNERLAAEITSMTTYNETRTHELAASVEQCVRLKSALELERGKQMDMAIKMALAAGAIENREQLLELERNTVHAMSEQLESVRAAGKIALHALERSTPHGATSMSDDHADASWLRHSAAKKAMKAGGAA